ncbi:LysM peptidoglycan-binding domain-containing M23 family metallopeptidase [Dethiobacter alkaliphilus]|uniref:Peptidase M23 n=1 Tax=Dethiobacter alkaliphilus AHT 1 TaxID=555088 RepID=C0GF68_DETAL|nr:M23 family metallopeptidase [Dethiobacter alkaliphilus]EEG77828.1 Peptidase M23 [Dethiobacter alkaliphilus AHT 1]
MRRKIIMLMLLPALMLLLAGCNEIEETFATDSQPPGIKEEETNSGDDLTTEDDASDEQENAKEDAEKEEETEGKEEKERESIPEDREEEIEYRVKKGDTLTKIAARYHVETEAIINKNELHNPNLIKAGELLVIPPPGVEIPVPDSLKRQKAEQPALREGGNKPAELDFKRMSAAQLINALSYMKMPIKGAAVTSVNGQLPNAPRSYRNGVHEGLDFYNTAGKSVRAVADGKIIRADHDFKEMTPKEYDKAIERAMAASITPEEILDKLRGMQVWIEHKDGVVTRYCHLDSISSDVKVGQSVSQGQTIGKVGNTGTKNSVVGENLSASGAPHLHFEIWYQGAFLGQGRPLSEVRKIYTQVLR